MRAGVAVGGATTQKPEDAGVELSAGRPDAGLRHVSTPSAVNAVPRPRVLHILDQAAGSPIVLVCGPAGSGKSLLVSSWVRDRVPEHSVWVSMHPLGQRPHQIWSVIVQALAATQAPDAELESLSEVAGRTPAEVPSRLGGRLAEQAHQTVLVIDDLHCVTDLQIHEQLIELVTVAAGQLRLIAVSRHDPPWPLHRMRLDGFVTTVRGSALAFDEEETRALFGALGVSLSQAGLVRLLARTDGWVAGLRLTALGASRAPDADAFIESVSGRDEYIADYLLREVYEDLPEDWQRFLARICVVDEVCSDLAEALGAGPDSGDRLVALSRQNAFIHQLGDRLGWYRLHPLLLDFLRSRFADRSRWRALHGRAARWFKDQRDFRSAIRHAIEAEDWSVAGELAGTHVVSWVVCRSPSDFRETLSAVPREAILSDPGLAIGLAAALSMEGRADEVPELVAAARERLGGVTGQQRRRYAFVLDLISVGNRRWVGDLETVLTGYREMPVDPAALGDLGLADWAAVHTLLINNLGAAELWTGDRDAARGHLLDAVRLGSAQSLALPTLNAQAHLAYLSWTGGELTEAETMARRALDGFVAIGLRDALQARCAFLALAGVAVDRDQLDDARRWLDLADSFPGEPQTEFAAELMSARLLAARGRLFEAVTAIRNSRTRRLTSPLPEFMITQSVVLEAQLLAGAGNAAEARRALVPPVVQGAVEPDTVRGRVETRLAQMRRLLAADRRQAALDELELALAAAAPERLRQPFLAQPELMAGLLAARVQLGTRHPDFVADLLDRAAGDSARTRSGEAAVFVPLTARETNILRYLATTLTAKEIAQSLYVSVNTIKTHQRAIHQKLGAKDRREAVAHARALDLI